MRMHWEHLKFCAILFEMRANLLPTWPSRLRSDDSARPPFPLLSSLPALFFFAIGCGDTPVSPLPKPEPPPVVVPPSTHPIVFSSLRDSTFGVGGRRNFEILVSREDGSDLINLSRNSAEDTDPSWSPDGKYIAFASNRNGVADPGYAPTYDIFIMRDDGTDVRQITSDTMNERYPTWSPDGKKILYQSPRDGALPGPRFFDTPTCSCCTLTVLAFTT